MFGYFNCCGLLVCTCPLSFRRLTWIVVWFVAPEHACLCWAEEPCLWRAVFEQEICFEHTLHDGPLFAFVAATSQSLKAGYFIQSEWNFCPYFFFAIFVGGFPSSSDDPESAMLSCFDLGYGIVAILYSAKFIASDWQLLRKKPNWKVKLFIEKCQNSENTVYKSIVSRLFAVEPRPGRDNLNIKFNFNCSNKFFLLNNWCRIPEKRVLHYLKFPGTLVIHRRGSITVLRKF